MKNIAIIQLGLGGVGRELARQILAQRDLLAHRYDLGLDYMLLADSTGILYTDTPLGPDTINEVLAAKATFHQLTDVPGATWGNRWSDLLPKTPSIIVDVTASSGHESQLARATLAGHRVVLANKRPLSGTYSTFAALTNGGATRYEATVGAGLPVISTLQGLLDSGDEVLRIEAAMSGTLGFICSALEAGAKLSEAVREAHSLGYTEPDPRDDLSGADVARKALILARSCGLPWEPSAVTAEPLFPDELASVSRDEFMARLDELDGPMAERVAAARKRSEFLRYVATISPSGASVGLHAMPSAHPLSTLRGPDNLFSFTTTRYNERPLVVRGPGAGQSVTAAGVLGDIIATAREIAI